MTTFKIFKLQFHARIQRGMKGVMTLLENQAITGCHNKPTSETPMKWRFAGGPMMARLEYWYVPRLPSVKYDEAKKNQSFEIFGPPPPPPENILDPRLCFYCHLSLA